ncbi:MAG: efflux RND transporter periplasmic adaptor subunit [Maricaulaceae bacterium]
MNIQDYPYADRFTTLAEVKTPRIIIVVAVMAIVMFFGVGAFLYFVPWVQTTSGAGQVTALNPDDRVQDINALVSGRIEEWFVRDGSIVAAGDPIVRIIDNDPQLLDRLRAERGQVVARLNAARTAKETAELNRDRAQRLFREGLASEREFEQARIRVAEMEGRVAEAAADLERIEVNLSRSSVQTVSAPRDGVILRVNAGDTATFISAGDPIASFAPTGAQRAVEIFIDGRDVALVTPGAPARLQFEGWPVVQFDGWPSIAVGTFKGVVTAIDPSADQAGRFRVLISEDPEAETPWPDERFVRFGATARGWVLLETVSVGYELWRQLNNFPPRFPEANAETGP